MLPIARSLLVFCCLWSTSIAPAYTSAEIIYRCSTDDGRVEFTDLPCRNGVPAQLGAGTGISMPALTEHEVERIAAIDRDAAAERERSTRESERRARERATQQARSAALCEQATQTLAQLRAQRRRGYRAREDAKLNAAEVSARSIASENCQ
jgi:hypothetical protein